MKKAYTEPRLKRVSLLNEQGVLAACYSKIGGGINGPGSWFNDCANTGGGITPCVTLA